MLRGNENKRIFGTIVIIVLCLGAVCAAKTPIDPNIIPPKPPSPVPVIPDKAWDPYPADGATDVTTDVVLSWKPGGIWLVGQEPFSIEYDVYFEGEYKGRQGATSYNPGGLEPGEDYNWCIDQVEYYPDETILVKTGDDWSFTTGDYLVVDDFESYVDHADLWATWKDGSVNETGSTVQLSTEPVHGGAQAMKFAYNNLNPPYYSETEMEFDNPQDWTRYGVKALSLSFCAEPNNSEECVCVCISDGTHELIMSECECPISYDCVVGWQEWNIGLQEFADAGIDLTDVRKMCIRVGDRDNATVPGGRGTLYIDDITLGAPRYECGPIGDLNLDWVVDFKDLAIVANHWLEKGPVPCVSDAVPVTTEGSKKCIYKISKVVGTWPGNLIPGMPCWLDFCKTKHECPDKIIHKESENKCIIYELQACEQTDREREHWLRACLPHNATSCP